MRRLTIYFIAFAITVLSTPSATAQKVYTVEQVPNVQLTDRDNAVSNPDGILSPEAIVEINNTIIGLRRATSIEIAVVAISSIGEDTPEEFALKLFEKWGLGKREHDNGLLILLAADDRFVRFEVGKGLEGVLTDAITRRIRDNRMVPYFAQDNWSEGMVAGVEATYECLTDPNSDLHREAETEPSNQDIGKFMIRFLLTMGAMGAIVFYFGYYRTRKERRCPKCGTMMKITDTTSEKLSKTLRIATTNMLCPKCGHKKTKSKREHISSGGAFAGGMMGGGFGGRGGGGGGGFGGGGGGFGGGSSGGGGGTSRF